MKKKKSLLNDELKAEGFTYDASTDELVSKDGQRVTREELEESPFKATAPKDGIRPELTRETLVPKNVKEKMSVWFAQDVLDEIRRLATKLPGGKAAPLINAALRQVFLPGTVDDESKSILSELTSQVPVGGISAPTAGPVNFLEAVVTQLEKELAQGERPSIEDRLNRLEDIIRIRSRISSAGNQNPQQPAPISASRSG